MQFRLLFILLLLGRISFAQPGNQVKIAGTKCSIIPPEGFVTATSFSGLQDPETGAAILINELPAPYQTLIDGFTPEALKAKGMTFISKETIELNNSKATLFKITQCANGVLYEKLFLLFGDATHTVFVNGMYGETVKFVETKIKEALLSTTYNPQQDDNPLDAATFTINTDETEFKLVKYMSGSLLYSTDGKLPTTKPVLTVGNSLSKIPAQNQKRYAEERIKQFPDGEFTIIKEMHEITIDNLKGYEIIANGKDKKSNKPTLAYQVILFTEEEDYFLIFGEANENFEDNLAAYKKIARTFKRK